MKKKISLEKKVKRSNLKALKVDNKFFKIAGIWKDRNITIAAIREKAWRNGIKK